MNRSLNKVCLGGCRQARHPPLDAVAEIATSSLLAGSDLPPALRPCTRPIRFRAYLSLRAPEIAPHAADQRDEGLLFDADQPPLTQFADRGGSHLRRHPKLGYPDAASRPLEQLEQQLGARRSAWMLNRGEDHVAVVPFETLALDTQSEDEPFAEAIRKAAARDV